MHINGRFMKYFNFKWYKYFNFWENLMPAIMKYVCSNSEY